MCCTSIINRVAITILFSILATAIRAQVVVIPSMFGVQNRAGIPPVMGTLTLTSTASTSATFNYVLTSVSGSAITARGLVWGTSSNPTISGSKTTTSGGANNSTYSQSISLTTPTLYYVRAYATNSAGTSYSNELLVDMRDFLGVEPWGSATLVTQASIQNWFDSNKFAGSTSPATSSPGAYPMTVPNAVAGYCLYLSDNLWYYKSGDPNDPNTWTNMTQFYNGLKSDFSAKISYIRMKRQ